MDLYLKALLYTAGLSLFVLGVAWIALSHPVVLLIFSALALVCGLYVIIFGVLRDQSSIKNS